MKQQKKYRIDYSIVDSWEEMMIVSAYNKKEARRKSRLGLYKIRNITQITDEEAEKLSKFAFRCIA